MYALTTFPQSIYISIGMEMRSFGMGLFGDSLASRPIYVRYTVIYFTERVSQLYNAD